MSARVLRVGTIAAIMLFAGSVAAQDLQRNLTQYFAGSAIQFGFGSGISSNSPRIELVIQYCASGVFYSAGRSCRPNLIARGHQCTPMQDARKWRIVAQGNQAALQWASNSGNTGGTALHVRGDGVVVDPRGNPFVRVGRAQCR
jgi:hypothetical protein